jgi:ectoine hydroxylase-related dioxygenase (phytanoyl-CoA dioxygenase family)
MAGLTEEQRARYWDDGFLVLPAVFNKREVTQMAGESSRLAQWQVSISLALGAPTPRLDVRRRNGQVLLRTIQPVNDVSPVFTKYSIDERLLRPLYDLLGCEPVLMEEKLNFKQVLPGNPEVVTGDGLDDSYPFHTDLAYFWLDGYPPETLSSAITIDATTEDNGPICVVPGSHRREWPFREGWPPVLADGAVADDEVVPLVAPPGSVFIFHSALVHSSSPNRSDTPRRLMIFSHYPCTHPAEADKRNRELRLAGQAAEDRYEELVYSGAPVPEYRMK